MKILGTAIGALVLALSAQVAQAYVAQVVTSVPVTAETNLDDTSERGEFIASAVGNAIHGAIAFTPTVVRIQDARIIGERLYLVILVADADGESFIKKLDAARGLAPGSEPLDDDEVEGTPEPGSIQF